jgi:hypothetical protein
MKKRSSQLSALMLATAIVAGSGVPFAALATPALAAEATAAAVAISKEDAVKKARTLFDISEEKWVLNLSELRTSQDAVTKSTRTTWQLNFGAADKNPAGVSVMIDANTGRVYSMDRYNKMKQPTGNTTREQASVTVQKLVQQLDPTLLKQTVPSDEKVPLGYQNGYHLFKFERKAGDAYVLGDQLQVMVAPDGTVSSYNLHWTDVEIPAAAAPKVDAKTANDIYAKTLDMRLSYVQVYKGKPETMLTYSPSYSYQGWGMGMSAPAIQPLIDAQTGKTLAPDGSELANVNRPADEPLVKDGPLAPTPRTTVLTEDEVKQLAAQYALIPSDAKLSEISYSESQSKVWSLRYTTSDATPDKAMPEINLTINALTGEIVNFDMWGGKWGQTPSGGTRLSEDVLKNKAVDLVKKAFKDRTGGLVLKSGNRSMEDPYVTYYFSIMKDGIPTSQGVNVMLDASTGSVRSLYGDFLRNGDQEPTYPSAKDAVSVDKAKSVYLEHRPLRLTYVFPTTKDSRATTPVLVYTPATSNYDSFTVNAKNGEWYDMNSSYYPTPAVLPSDIKGHWAEKALTKFAEQGVLELTDGKANPDQKMTRGTLIRLLADGSHLYYPQQPKPTFEDVPADSKYFNQIEAAVSRGWISKDAKFRPNDTISREETATIFARVLGLQELSKHREIFQLPYSDQSAISDYAFGSVSIMYGIGTMKGANNEFRPKATITLAEAVTMFDRLPQNMSGPIYK